MSHQYKRRKSKHKRGGNSDDDVSVYSEDAHQLIMKKWDDIKQQAEDRKNEILEPTGAEKRAVYSAINDFIKSKGRIIYGGTALNKCIKLKNPKDGIYDEKEFPDVEFYTPTPLQDLVELVDYLDKKKFKHVSGREAQHQETYKISVNYMDYCDISYVPTLIYNNMPYIIIDGIKYIHPQFALIDMYRQMTDPLTSYWRLDKMLKRVPKLLKYYPMELKTKKTNKLLVPKYPELLNNVVKKITNSNSLLFTGIYASNFYINQTLDVKNTPYIDVISTNYRDDCIELLRIVTSLVSDKTKIDVVESYPFFQFYGQKVSIIYDKTPIVNIYHYNHRCLPYQIVKFNKTGKIRIGTFQHTVMMLNMFRFRAKVEKNFEMYKNYEALMYQCFKARNEYLKKHKKTIFDDTIYREFILECMGKTVSFDIEYHKRIKQRIEKGKPATFRYEPDESRDKSKIYEYKFANTSGNAINYPKNLTLQISSIPNYQKLRNREGTHDNEEKTNNRKNQKDEDE